MDPEEILRRLREGDTAALAAAGGVVVGAVLLVLLFRSRRDVVRKAPDRSALQARERLCSELRSFRTALQRAADGAAPVWASIREHTDHADPVGHWRKQRRHAFGLRFPDIDALKSLARTGRFDASPLLDLDRAARKAERWAREWDAGALDATPTPIATAAEMEKDLRSVVVLTDICLRKYA